MDLVIPVNHRVKVKGKKLEKYLNLERELKKLLIMKVTMIQIIVRHLGTKNLKKKIETVQTTSLMSSAGTLGRVLETSEKTTCYSSCENLH